MPLSPDDRRIIAGRAATVFDRAAALGDGPADGAADRDEGHSRAALVRWRQAFSPGDTAAFERRLSWDDLDEPRALRAMATPCDPSAFDRGHWTEWIDRILDEVPAVVADLAAGHWMAPAAEAAHPFDELRKPVRRAARRALTIALRAEAERRPDGQSPFDLVEPCIFGYLERQLDREITRAAELAWFERFQAVPAEERAADGTAAYRAFVLSLLRDLPGFFRDYARLAHQMATIVSAWVDASVEMFVRLRADRQAIGAAFAGGADPGLLVHIDTALSDPHHGRRRVAILWFESGLRVVYKPRGIGVEVAFGQLLAWLNNGLDAPLRVLRTLDRETHGWVEHAAPSPAFGLEEAVRYFRRAGALMCVTSVLGARDLHRDNLVATTGGPVLVDLELLLQPDRPTADALASGEAESASCLSTGMLSLIDIGPDGEPHDAGGLRGETRGTLPLPTRVWFDSGTNALRFDHISTFHTSRSHELVVDGRVQQPEAFASAITAGFADAYRYLVSQRDALLADGGPLDALGRCHVRVLPRLTNQYAMMAALVTSPACQRDGVTAGCAIDVLHRAFARSTERPALWPMVLEERRALLALDIPHFTVRADGTRASGGSRELDVDYFTISGLTSARRRIASLSMSAAAREVAVLERALSESVRSTFSIPPPGPRPTGADAFIDDAVWIARELRERAVSTGDLLEWPYRSRAGGPGWRDHHLYDGSVGTALFFQALADVTDDPQWADVAARSLEVVRRHLDRYPIESAPADEQLGAGNGLASVAYGLAVAVSMGADSALIDITRELAHGVIARLFEGSPRDVVNGSAGAALVFAALDEAVDDAVFRGAAEACAGHLLDSAVALGSDQLTWPQADGATLLGFAHGAAGMALALARVSRMHTDRGYGEAAHRAFAFIARQYQPTLSNWAVAVRSDDVVPHGAMNGWCHGAPGITLAALQAGDRGALPADLDPLLRAMAAWQPAQTDHLCCGNLARVEALLVAGRMLGREDVVEAGRAGLTRTVERARRRGHFRLSGAGTEYRVFDPGFFQGLAGIGYQLLRAARPDQLPSVAAFDTPRASLRYCSTGAGTDREAKVHGAPGSQDPEFH